MVENPFINSTNVILNLHQGDFSTALTVSEAINDIFGDNVAVPLDASSIKENQSTRLPVEIVSDFAIFTL